VQVAPGVPYRLWVHLRRGSQLQRATPGILHVQFTGAVDKEGNDLFPIGTNRSLLLRGTAQDRWGWVGKDLGQPQGPDAPLLYFKGGGEATVRVTSGVGGSGFDQFVLSPQRFLEKPPPDSVLPKADPRRPSR
jgi:hypothetical protein